jgi:amidase
MKLYEYACLDATAMATLISRGEVQAKELAELALRAISLLNPQLNAVLETWPERAETPMPGRRALLPGVPMLLKDTGATLKGKRQACGSRLGEDYIAPVNAYLTDFYQSAGLTILGRTALPEFAQAATTESALSGPTRNPWDLLRSTGGSSGGAAAAVAAGMVPIAHGTDTGGSIRIPAACCGLVGLKPSRGRISKGPALDETLYGGLNTEHVLTRSVRDTAIALDASCGAVPGDPFVIAPPLRPYRDEPGRAVSPLRVAVNGQAEGISVAPVMVESVLLVARLLEDMGHHTEEASPDYDVKAHGEADAVVWALSTAQEVRRIARATGNSASDQYLERPTLEALEFAQQMTPGHWFAAMDTYNCMRRQFGRFFNDYDIMLTPTVTTPAPLLGSLNSNRDISYREFMRLTGEFCPHTAPFNVTGQPAISLPLCTTAEGLPVGIQLAARFGNEALLLRLAAALEEALPWRDRLAPINAAHIQ